MFSRKFWTLRKLIKVSGFLLRGLACYFIGIGLLFLGESQNYDLRFKLRGPKPVSKDIVLVTISEAEALAFYGSRLNLMRPLREATNFSDSFFWDKDIWSLLLKTILAEDPKAIGVTFYFGESLSDLVLSPTEQEILYHPKIVWGSVLTAENRVLFSRFTNPFGDNSGVLDTPVGVDRIARFFDLRNLKGNHFAITLLNSAGETVKNVANLLTSELKPIHYMGGSASYQTVTLSEIKAKADTESFQFKDKIVLIGSADTQGHIIYTPLGPMNRAEFIANIVQNLREDLWIHEVHSIFYGLFLLIVAVVGVVVVISYPQTVALLIFMWLGTSVFAFTTYTFDTYNLWFPLQAPLLMLLAIWIVFISYNSVLAEQRSWRLEQEQSLILEMEELKNNFVSLISHDLKTPIAKIQALADQLSTVIKDASLLETIQSIRSSSEDLNRYIRSIINLSRVEARNIKLRRDAVDLNELVKDVINSFQPLVRKKHLQVQLNLEPMFSIEADQQLIREVVSNLIENAIKYSPEASQVTVSTEELNDRVTFAVNNGGDPIPEPEQKRVWQKFVRGHEQSLLTQGTGLGLYLVKYFVELHGGQVNLTSNRSSGTTVSFTLPVDADGTLTDENSLEIFNDSNLNLFAVNQGAKLDE